MTVEPLNIRSAPNPPLTSKPTIQNRVRKGMAWLDQNQLGWEKKIDLKILDLGDAYHCILGQVYGHFNACPQVPLACGLTWSYEHGFINSPDWSYSAQDYKVLTEAWLEGVGALTQGYKLA